MRKNEEKYQQKHQQQQTPVESNAENVYRWFDLHKIVVAAACFSYGKFVFFFLFAWKNETLLSLINVKIFIIIFVVVLLEYFS